MAPLGAVLGVYIVCPDLSVLMWLVWEQFSVSTLFAQTCLSKQCGSSGSSSQCLHCLPRPVCPNNVAPLGAVLGVYIVCPDLSVLMWLLWEQFSVSTLFAQTCLSKQCGSSGSSSRCLHCLPRPVCPNVAPLGAVLSVYIVCPDLSVQTMWLLWEQFSVSTLFAQTCLSKMWLLWEQFSVSTLFAQTCLSKQCGSSGSSSRCLHCLPRPVCPNNVAPLGAVLGVYIVCPDLSVQKLSIITVYYMFVFLSINDMGVYAWKKKPVNSDSKE